MAVNKPEDRPQLIRVTKAAREIGIATSTARRLIASGKIKSVRVGSRTFIAASELERVVREGC